MEQTKTLMLAVSLLATSIGSRYVLDRETLTADGMCSYLQLHVIE